MAVRSFQINGERRDVGVDADASLLDVLRNGLGLTGAKEACGRGECGACTVLIDGRAILSCIHMAELVEGDVWTIEGVAETSRDLREAFADCGAFQCGFCTPGQILRAESLLREIWPIDPREAEAFVRAGMTGNICRCTGYTGIVDAVLRVARARGVARPA